MPKITLVGPEAGPILQKRFGEDWKLKTYLFQLADQEEVYEVQAEDSAEAFRRCLREKRWPIERVLFLGFKEKEGEAPGKSDEGKGKTG